VIITHTTLPLPFLYAPHSLPQALYQHQSSAAFFIGRRLMPDRFLFAGVPYVNGEAVPVGHEPEPDNGNNGEVFLEP
jgi:hypothetical protein